MKYQIQKLSELLGESDAKALKFAAGLKCLGRHRDVIQRGWASSRNPQFYRELGRDPVADQQEAMRAIRTLIREG